MGGGSGLLPATEGDVCVRSLCAPVGLEKVSLEFEKLLAPYFFDRQQTRRRLGEKEGWDAFPPNLEFLNFFFPLFFLLKFPEAAGLVSSEGSGPGLSQPPLRPGVGCFISVGQSPKRAVGRVCPSEVGFRSPCTASCIFIGSGHFVCRLTSDAKSRAPIKALRNKGAACLGAGGPPGAVPPSPL